MSLRALAGYMNSWIDAGDAERKQMLEEMKATLDVGIGITGMQQTRQGMQIAAGREGRAQQMFPSELGLSQLAVEGAEQGLEAARTKERFEEEQRPFLVGQEAARETMLSEEAGVAARTQQARVTTLETQLEQTQTALRETQDQLQRIETARTQLAAEGLPTAEYAAQRLGIVEPTEKAFGAEARVRAGLPFLDADAQAREAEYKSVYTQAMLDKNYAPQIIDLQLEKMKAEIDKLRISALTQSLGGKSAVDYRNDLMKQIASMTEVVAKIRLTPTLENAVKILGPTHPVIALMQFSGVDPENVLPTLEGHINAIKSFLWIDFHLNYDKLAEEGAIDFSKLPMGDAASYLQQMPPAPGAGALRIGGEEAGTTRVEQPTGPRTLPAPGTAPIPETPPVPETPAIPATPTGWEGIDIESIINELQKPEE